ncbi:MAG: GNAT family N-acetyltransferase [Tannerella sp.]|nr:GNAT family N-acetyltransferase [Tannerella sp.]
MTSKQTYRTLCRTEKSIPIFSQDWWLDATCGETNWDVLLIEKNGRILAAWPLYMPLRGVVTMPPYTQTMGIWFAPPSGNDTKYGTMLEQRQTLCKQLIEKLDARSFLQNFNHSFTDWLPFYWNGYGQTTRYTYLLGNLKNSELLWNGMNRNMRRNIHAARECAHITVRQGVPADDLLRLQAQTFERQNKRNGQDPHVLRRLVHVCRRRGQGEIWGGYDRQERLHATAFVVYQQSAAYYIAGGGDPALRRSCAHSLVLWEAIRFAAAHSETFDFEGSMLPGVERFFREFGAVQTPYFAISKGKLSLTDRAGIKFRKYIKKLF